MKSKLKLKINEKFFLYDNIDNTYTKFFIKYKNKKLNKIELFFEGYENSMFYTFEQFENYLELKKFILFDIKLLNKTT